MIRSPITGDAHELKMSEINKENKQGSHISSFRNKLMHQSYIEKGKGTLKTEHAHRRINSTEINKWLFLYIPKQEVDAQKRRRKIVENENKKPCGSEKTRSYISQTWKTLLKKKVARLRTPLP